jgi:hypothetical protein
MDALARGQTEHPLMPLTQSVQLAELMENARLSSRSKI